MRCILSETIWNEYYKNSHENGKSGQSSGLCMFVTIFFVRPSLITWGFKSRTIVLSTSLLFITRMRKNIHRKLFLALPLLTALCRVACRRFSSSVRGTTSQLVVAIAPFCVDHGHRSLWIDILHRIQLHVYGGRARIHIVPFGAARSTHLNFFLQFCRIYRVPRWRTHFAWLRTPRDRVAVQRPWSSASVEEYIFGAGRYQPAFLRWLWQCGKAYLYERIAAVVLAREARVLDQFVRNTSEHVMNKSSATSSGLCSDLGESLRI